MVVALPRVRRGRGGRRGSGTRFPLTSNRAWRGDGAQEGEAHEAQGGNLDDVETQDPLGFASLGEDGIDVDGVRREIRQLAVTVAGVMGRARKGSSRISIVSPAARNAISAADTKALE